MTRFIALLILQMSAVVWQCREAQGATLYGVTLRNPASGVAETAGGALYVIDPATATAHRQALLTINGRPFGLRGLAVHPKTQALYGITAGLVPAFARSLVTLDPATGKATLVGSLGMNASDINFDKSGTLYAWLPEINALGIVDLGTAAVKPIATSGLAETVGGGFAMRGDRAALLSATSAAGTLDTIDLATGQVKPGPHLTGAPFVAAITAMDFSPAGRLYAINTNLGAPARAALVSIDEKSGRVTLINDLPDDMTALAFAPEAGEDMAGSASHRALLIWVPTSGLIGLAIGVLIGSRRPRKA